MIEKKTLGEMDKGIMKVKLDEGAIMPRREHDTDAGYDLFTPRAFVLPRNGIEHIDTGVHIQLSKGVCALVFSKSGLLKNHGVLSMGLVDEGYRGSIGVTLVNLSGNPLCFRRGEKISQFFITNYYGFDLEVVEELEATDRGEAGFGSTGRT